MNQQRRQTFSSTLREVFEQQNERNASQASEHVSSINEICSRDMPDTDKVAKIESVLGIETTMGFVVKATIGIVLVLIAVFMVLDEYSHAAQHVYQYWLTCIFAVGLGLAGTGMAGRLSVGGPNLRASGAIAFSVFLIMMAPNGEQKASPPDRFSTTESVEQGSWLQLLELAGTAHAQAHVRHAKVDVDAAIRIYYPGGDPAAKRAAFRIQEALAARRVEVYSLGSIFRKLLNRVTADGSQHYKVEIKHLRQIPSAEIDKVVRLAVDMFPGSRVEVYRAEAENVVSEVDIYLWPES